MVGGRALGESHGGPLPGPVNVELMISKLDPPDGIQVVLTRPRLLDRLTAAVSGPLTLVTAPAGAGKTTLLRSWLVAGRTPGAVVWIGLDGGDRHPGSFWSYVLAGLDRAGVTAPEGWPPRCGTDEGWPLVSWLSAWLYQRTEPVVLVLDDADVLVDSAIPGQLDFLVRHAGSTLRLVLLSRGDPEAHRHRRRLDGSVAELRGADLAATAAEARELLDLHGVTLSDQSLRTVLRRTGGWMAGLTLTALALKEVGAGDGAGSAIRGDRALLGCADADITDYLDVEVLRGLPSADRQLLLRVGLADHVPGPLAEELSGRPGVRPALENLGRRTSFVERCHRHEDCYHLHPLLAELVQSRHSRGASRRLHRRASAWYAAAGKWVDATAHAAAAGDWAHAASTLVGGLLIACLRCGPQSHRLLQVLADMPLDAPGSEAAVALAAIALAKGDAKTCAEQLARAEELIEDVPTRHSPALALALPTVAAGLAGLTGDADRALAASAALHRATEDLAAAGATPPPETRWLVLADVGVALLRAGRLDPAAAVLTEAEAAVPPWLSPIRSEVEARLALVEALRGRVGRARELVGEAAGTAVSQDDLAPGGRSSSRRPAEAQAAIALAAVEAGHPDEAERYAEAAGDVDDPVAAPVLCLARAGSLRLARRPEAALAVLTAARRQVAEDPPPSWVDRLLVAGEAATRTMNGDPDAALRCMDDAGRSGPEISLEIARASLVRGERGRCAAVVADLLRRADLTLDVRVDACMLRAAAALENGDLAAARAAANRALRLAAPERLRRPILEAPTRVRRFLLHDSRLAAGRAWLDGTAVSCRAGRPPARTTVRTGDMAADRNPGSRADRTPGPAQDHGRVDPAGQSDPQRSRPVVVEPLTSKESEVLGHLAALLSTDEIAHTMFVSVSTVKSHVRAILRKLGAARRNEAVRRARELQLI